MKTNLTEGSVFKAVAYFSLPYLLSYFMQTLYGTADLFIIGQFNGVDSITAVSVGSQVMHMLTVIIVGLAMGSTVMIGRSVGAKRNDDTASFIGNTVTLFLTVSIIFTAALLFFVNPIVSLMSTPEEAVFETVEYLTICFIGIPFITAYNIISSIFRGMGDSKSPMYFVAAACVSNIALDYLFIGGLKLGAAGAALGTTLSQTLSVIISLIVIIKKEPKLKLSLKDFKPQRKTMSAILKVGVPVAVQDGFIQISFIIITIIANKRGLNDAAAVGIVEKIIGVLFLVPSSMLSSVSALSSLNIGAKKYDRAKNTLKYAIMISVIFGATVSIIIQFTSENIVGLFSESETVTILGGQYLKGYVWDCLLAGIHFCFSGYFCAYGLSGISFFHNAVSIVCARVPLAYLASKYFVDTLFPMGLATAAGSLLSVIICIAVFILMNKNHFKTVNTLQ